MKKNKPSSKKARKAKQAAVSNAANTLNSANPAEKPVLPPVSVTEEPPKKKKPILPLTKLQRIQKYINLLQENSPLTSARDIAQAQILNEKRKSVESKIKTATTLKTTAFVFLYASLISNLVIGVGVLQYFTETLTFVSTLLGSGLLVLIILFMNHLLEGYYAELQLISSHLISIYVRNEEGWNPKVIELLEQALD